MPCSRRSSAAWSLPMDFTASTLTVRRSTASDTVSKEPLSIWIARWSWAAVTAHGLHREHVASPAMDGERYGGREALAIARPCQLTALNATA